MSFLRRYIFSTDHKMIGQQYYFLALVSVFIGIFSCIPSRTFPSRRI